jgi:hypothetical protein
MHKSATKCNETVGKWCKNKYGASKIIDTLETYHTMVLLQQARQHMKFMADKKHTEREFSVGDWVFLKMQPYV